MVRGASSIFGQPIQVPAGLEGTCKRCMERGMPGYGEMVTEGTEIADVRREKYFNGRFTVTTDTPVVILQCPDCGNRVQFELPRGFTP